MPKNNFQKGEIIIYKIKHKLLSGQEQEILNLLANYSKTLSLLEQYDKDKLLQPL